MLEAMAGTGADDQNVRAIRMTVDQEVAVRGVLILADPRFGERRGRPAPGSAAAR